MDHGTARGHLTTGLAERGVHDPHLASVAEQLHARGLTPDQILALITKFGPVALQVAEDLIALFGKGS